MAKKKLNVHVDVKANVLVKKHVNADTKMVKNVHVTNNVFYTLFLLSITFENVLIFFKH